ncbi:MAG: hypothetical protein ACK5PQ_04935 [Alphaproteobacteria bacterium]
MTDPENPAEITCASCILLNARFGLTSSHVANLLKPGTTSVASLAPRVPFDEKGYYDIKGLLKIDPTVSIQISKITPLSDVQFQPTAEDLKHTTEPQSTEETPLGETDIEDTISSLTESLNTMEFYTRVADQDMVANSDCVVFELCKPMAGVSSLELTPYHPATLSLVYGIGYISKMTFSTGEKSFDGKLPPLISKKNRSQKVVPFIERGEEGNIFNKIIPQVFMHRVSEISAKGKAFSVFAQSVEGEDESYKFSASWPFHKRDMPNDEATLNILKPLCRPFVGGMSGGPIFSKNEDGSFNLVGLVSQSLEVGVQVSGESPHPHTLNIFQLLTPELLEKIEKIIGSSI